MKSINILFIIFFVSILSCYFHEPKYCDGGWDNRLKIINNSDKNCYVYHSAAYPDTNSYLLFTDYEVSKTGIGYVKANNTTIQEERCTWEDYFNAYVKSDTLMIFIILDEGQGTNHLKDYHTVLKRYDFTLQDLKNMNWTIKYP